MKGTGGVQNTEWTKIYYAQSNQNRLETDIDTSLHLASQDILERMKAMQKIYTYAEASMRRTHGRQDSLLLVLELCYYN